MTEKSHFLLFYFGPLIFFMNTNSNGSGERGFEYTYANVLSDFGCVDRLIRCQQVSTGGAKIESRNGM